MNLQWICEFVAGQKIKGGAVKKYLLSPYEMDGLSILKGVHDKPSPVWDLHVFPHLNDTKVGPPTLVSFIVEHVKRGFHEI